MYPTKPLGEICEILLGGTPSRNEKEFWGGKNLWCSIADMKEKVIFDTKEKITEKGIQNSNVKLLEEGTLFMSFKLSLGKLAFAGEKLYTNEAIAGLPIKNTKEIDKYFLYYFLLGYNFFKNGTDNSVKGATLNKEKLKQIQIPLPPLPAQQKTVEKLDKIFAKIDKNIELTKQNIANIDEENNAILEKIFKECEEGFGVEKLGNIFEITSSKRVFKSEWKNEGIPFYRAREIVKLTKYDHIDNELFITKEMFNEYKKKYGVPKMGDIMITGVGTLGVPYVVKENDEFYFKDGNIIWLKKNSKEVLSRFIEYGFYSEYIKKQVSEISGTSVGTYTIIRAKNTKIPLPPLPKQQEIVTYLDNIFAKNSELKNFYEKNLKNLEELRQSILKQAFEDENFIK